MLRATLSGPLVVAQAAAWAKQLGRTFVEPVYCRSRVVPPFKSLQEAGPAVQRALGATGAQWTCPGQDKERLGATREVHDMCTQVPVLSAALFRNRTLAGPALRDSVAAFFHKTDFRSIERNGRDKRIIYLVGFHRSVNNDQIAAGACLVKRCHGMLFGPAPRLVADVRAAAAAARP